MLHPSRRQSSSSPSPAACPSRPPLPPVEVLYNTAVQSFVRRDHVKTHATLSRLLTLLRTSSKRASTWYDLEPSVYTVDGQADAGGTGSYVGDRADDEWTMKSLKLLISAHASLYSDPPPSSSLAALPPDLLRLLPPSSPRPLLELVRDICQTTYFPLGSPSSDRPGSDIMPALLPPQLVSTLILAALKLGSHTDALDFAHHITEEWLAALPDHFITAISTPPGSTATAAAAEHRKRVESAREGYLKVVELFVGEVLAREGEWEMARGVLDGEPLLSSKRKEALYRHLRALRTKSIPAPPTASPSSSLLLADNDQPKTASPSPNPASKTRSKARVNGSSSSARSRSSSTSSSSSERTARPANIGVTERLASTTTTSTSAYLNRSNGLDRKGKSKVVEQVDGAAARAKPENGVLHINGDPGTPRTRTSSHDQQLYSSSSNNGPSQEGSRPHRRSPPGNEDQIQTTFSRLVYHTVHALPPSISKHLVPLLHTPLRGYVSLPLILVPILIIMGMRRRRRRLSLARAAGSASSGSAASGLAGPAGIAGTARLGVDGAERTRQLQLLARARARQGWIAWIGYYLKWWMAKFGGIWKLGTTITYV